MVGRCVLHELLLRAKAKASPDQGVCHRYFSRWEFDEGRHCASPNSGISRSNPKSMVSALPTRLVPGLRVARCVRLGAVNLDEQWSDPLSVNNGSWRQIFSWCWCTAVLSCQWKIWQVASIHGQGGPLGGQSARKAGRGRTGNHQLHPDPAS